MTDQAVEAGARAIWQTGHRFAEGGIVTRPMAGIVGDAGPEAIIPLKRRGAIIDYSAIADAVGNAVFAAIRESARIARVEQGREDGGREVILELDGVKLGRVVLPTLTRERMRIGIAEV
jgi:hypothetical protein